MSQPKHICKFRPINKHTEEIFLKRTLFFGYVEDFNDPFEFSMNLSAKEFESRKTVINHGFKNYFTVFCASEVDTKNNVLLWSHYADHHRGICIEFTPKYKNKKSPFYKLEPVQYSNKMSVPKFDSGTKSGAMVYLQSLRDALSTKAKYWEYEKEWRALELNTSGEKVEKALYNDLKIDIGRRHKFESFELTKVILGCKITKNDERTVINWINELNNTQTLVEKCVIDESDYKLNFIQLK